MKAITFTTILTGASTRSDGSLSLRLATSELQPSEKTVFFEMLNQSIKALFQPIEGAPENLVEVRKEFDKKTPSQRLRACLYRLWEWDKSQKKTEIDFEAYYLDHMEIMIQKIKDQLPEPAY